MFTVLRNRHTKSGQGRKKRDQGTSTQVTTTRHLHIFSSFTSLSYRHIFVRIVNSLYPLAILLVLLFALVPVSPVCILAWLALPLIIICLDLDSRQSQSLVPGSTVSSSYLALRSLYVGGRADWCEDVGEVRLLGGDGGMGVRGHWEITANLHRRPRRIFTASVFTAMIDIDCVLEMQER